MQGRPVPPWRLTPRWVGAVAAALGTTVVFAGCTTGSTSQTGATTAAAGTAAHAGQPRPGAATASPTRSGPWSMVALGDSVPAGSGCGCTPYPQLSAADLSATGGGQVTAANHAVGGYTTQDVERQLNQADGDPAVIAEVTGADVVEVEVGANDVPYSDTCGTDAACYSPRVKQAEEGLDAVVRRVRDLAAGRPVMVVLLDYWSVWLGGTYAQAKGQAYVNAATAVTDAVNTAVKAVAERTGSAYVDLRAAFKGPDYAYDETHYLAPDGDHPNAAGHAKIAESVAAVIRDRLDLP